MRKIDQDEIKSLFAKLHLEGVEEIQISYEGGGDSGYIEDIYYTPETPENSKEYTKIIEDWAYDMLGYHLENDWYNNEGGGGSMYINLEESNWHIDGYYRVVEYEEHKGSFLQL
jgi:hypothetical protein